MGPSSLPNPLHSKAEASNNADLEKKAVGLFVVFSIISCSAIPVYFANIVLPSASFTPWFVGAIFLIEASAILVLRLALVEFAKIDSERFSRPTKLAILLAVGLIVILLGTLLLLNWANSALANASSTFVASNSKELLEGEAIFTVGLAAALAGAVGVVQGLWRLGQKYDSTALKLGAILLVFPYLDIVSAILLLVGGLDIKRHLLEGSGVSSTK